MSLLEKLENYAQIMQDGDGYSSLGTEIIEDMKDIMISIKSLKDAPQDQRLDELWKAFTSSPNALFDNHSQELLEILLENTSDGIYKVYNDGAVDLKSTENIEVEIKSLDELILRMLTTYLRKVSNKETSLYLKTFLEKKNKNLQQRFLYLELLSYISPLLNKKEAFLNDLFPDFLKIINTLFSKYLKYKARVDNQEYDEIPTRISDFLQYFELWIQGIFKKIITSLLSIRDSHKSPILSIEELYNESTLQYIGNTSTLDKNRIINHYCVLFLLDLLSIIHSNQLPNDLSNEFISQIISTIHIFTPRLSTLLSNYKSQVQVKDSDPASSTHNHRDNRTLLVESYHALTFYNPVSLALLAVRLADLSDSESFLLTPEYKLKLLFPCIYQLFGVPGRYEKLKEEILACTNQLLDTIILNNPPNSLQNINKFDMPLDKLMEILLDYAGGPVDEKHRTLGLGIYAKFNKLLSEKTRARLLLSIITTTKNYSLSGYLVSEFKSGISSALRASTEIKDAESPFLNLNYLGIFFEMGIYLESSKYKDDADLTGACINILMLVYLKLSNLTKNVPDFIKLEFKDSYNVFNPKNLSLVLNYGEKVFELSNKIQGDLELYNSQIEQLTKDEPNHPNLPAAFKKFNDLLVTNDSISRIHDIYKELMTVSS